MRFLLKAGGLLLILALPVLIYMFLQAFGKNKYDLPVYYENGVDTLITGCNFKAAGQYKVPARYFTHKQGRSTGQINIAFFRPSGVDISEALVAELARTMNIFKSEEVNLLLLSTPGQARFQQLQEKVIAYGNDSSQWSLFSAPQEYLMDNVVCDFVIPASNGQSVFPLLLIDKERKIRGYYQATERQEIDRLVVEINILLENDQGDSATEEDDTKQTQ